MDIVSGSLVDLAVSGRVGGNWRSYREKQECVAVAIIGAGMDKNGSIWLE